MIVPSLYLLRTELSAIELSYDYCRGIDPGVFYVQLQDPAGNWLQISDHRPSA